MASSSARAIFTAVSPAPHTTAYTRLRPIYRIEPAIAAFALILLMPLCAPLGMVIFGLSRRRPLVCHTRAGWRGTPLPMLKFRTMWGMDGVDGEIPETKAGGDPRVTSRFAAYCRKYSLDEIPQLWHVARGEMSLVGPRPVTAVEMERYYGEDAEEVLACRPGLTGLWQILGRNHLSYAQRKRLDLWFVRHASAGLYVRILLRSIPSVLGGRGAY